MDSSIIKFIYKMRDLRLAMQKGEFSADEKILIQKEMSELGITSEYEAEMKKIDFGTYLRNTIGNPPEGMVDPHAHHIVFKVGNGVKQQELVREAQAILREYGIDPIVGDANLVWAPMRVTGQHSTEALEKVVKGLREKYEYGADYDDIIKYLKAMGEIASGR